MGCFDWSHIDPCLFYSDVFLAAEPVQINKTPSPVKQSTLHTITIVCVQKASVSPPAPFFTVHQQHNKMNYGPWTARLLECIFVQFNFANNYERWIVHCIRICTRCGRMEDHTFWDTVLPSSGLMVQITFSQPTDSLVFFPAGLSFKGALCNNFAAINTYQRCDM